MRTGMVSSSHEVSTMVFVGLTLGLFLSGCGPETCQPQFSWGPGNVASKFCDSGWKKSGIGKTLEEATIKRSARQSYQVGEKAEKAFKALCKAGTFWGPLDNLFVGDMLSFLDYAGQQKACISTRAAVWTICGDPGRDARRHTKSRNVWPATKGPEETFDVKVDGNKTALFDEAKHTKTNLKNIAQIKAKYFGVDNLRPSKYWLNLCKPPDNVELPPGINWMNGKEADWCGGLSGKCCCPPGTYYDVSYSRNMLMPMQCDPIKRCPSLGVSTQTFNQSYIDESIMAFLENVPGVQLDLYSSSDELISPELWDSLLKELSPKCEEGTATASWSLNVATGKGDHEKLKTCIVAVALSPEWGEYAEKDEKQRKIIRQKTVE